jgi:hypothetical protein
MSTGLVSALGGASPSPTRRETGGIAARSRAGLETFDSLPRSAYETPERALMAGRGPAPKDPRDRARSNSPRPHGGSSTGRHHLSRHYRRPCRMALSGRSVLANGERCGGAILARPAITRPTGQCCSIPPYCMRSSGAEIPPSPVSFVSASRSTAQPRSTVIAFGPCKRHSEP